MSDFWSWWIIGLTVFTIVAVTWILFANRKTTSNPGGKTGHVYDGIEEFDNPLPAWWFYMFLGTIIFGVAYVIVYPGMGKFQGLLGWSQINQWEREVERADQRYGELFAKYGAMDIEELAENKKALKMGRRLFANNCAQCHGSDARGSFGFPNLADDQWLYGGSPAAIKTSIVDGRIAAMPAWLGPLGEEGIVEVSSYVRSLSADVSVDEKTLAQGKQKYQMFCSSCHGVEGKGNYAFGAPNIADDVWLYGGSLGEIQQTLRNGRNGQMPAHKELINSDKIHLLTAYVYSLSQKSQGVDEQ